MTDEIFRSMKAQMEPSDDVVADLLAKIAAESASPLTENENVIPFARAAELRAAVTESAPRKEFANTSTGRAKKKNSIWYYGTAVAASIIVMISTFTLLDPSEDGDNAGDLFGDVIGDTPTVVNPVRPDGSGSEGSGSPADGQDGQDSQTGQDSSQDSAVQDGDGSDSSAPGSEGSNGKGDSDKADGSSGKDGSGEEASGSENPYGEQNWDDPDALGNGSGSGNGSSGKDSKDNSANTGNGQTGNSGNGQNGNGQTAPADGKVTPGAVGSGNISWTSELRNASQVASISVSGSNYVVGSTVSRSEVGSTLETVTIDLPQTSSTNAAQVTARVCELKNVSSDAVVALDVEGFTQPLIYANADYSPANLGQFVTDLGLEGNTVFSSSVRCQISRVGYSSNQNYNADVTTAAWMYLLNQSSGERSSKGSFNSGTSKALFTSTSNPTGSQIKFGVSDSGCLQVTMLNKVFYFNVGAENAKGFLEYVTGESIG